MAWVLLSRYYKRASADFPDGVYAQLPFNWFGSVPLGREAVVESAHLKVQLSENYDEICQDVLAIAHNQALAKNVHIQSALLSLLPKLAAFQRDVFVSKYLSSTMNYMDKLLLAKDRYNAYMGIGILAVATGPDIQVWPLQLNFFLFPFCDN